MAATVWCTVSERPGCSLQVSRCSMFHVVPHLSGISSHASNKGITRPTSLQKNNIILKLNMIREMLIAGSVRECKLSNLSKIANFLNGRNSQGDCLFCLDQNICFWGVLLAIKTLSMITMSTVQVWFVACNSPSLFPLISCLSSIKASSLAKCHKHKHLVRTYC